jgi:hypothetical protein
MSKILYCGDPHGEFRHIVRAAEHSTPVRSCCSATSSRCGRSTRSWRHRVKGLVHPRQPRHGFRRQLVERLGRARSQSATSTGRS